MAVENVLLELDTAAEKVKELLKSFPSARHNDIFLQILYWKYVDGLPVWIDHKYIWGNEALTPASTISRVRRKLQEQARLGLEPEWLLPEGEVEERRYEREKGFKRWAVR